MPLLVRRSLLLAAFAAALAARASLPPLPSAENAPASGASVSFLAFGDAGTGGSGQRHVAASMRKVLASSPVDFAILLGDNFYPHGLASALDPRFDKVFGAVYTKDAFRFPFYAVAGNHDLDGNAGALLALGARDSRWRMPASSYSFESGAPCQGAPALRSPTAADRNVFDVPPTGEASRCGFSVLFVALDTSPYEARDAVESARTSERARATIAAAPSARWRVGFGHHPLRSSGLHDAGDETRRRLGALVESGALDLYFAGHEHFLEALEPPGGPPQVISGAASGWDEMSAFVHVRPESVFRLTGGGFVRAELGREGGSVVFYDGDGIARHTMKLAARKIAAPRAAAGPR